MRQLIKKLQLVWLLTTVAAGLIIAPAASASVYGGGSYGSCPYQQNCATSSSGATTTGSISSPSSKPSSPSGSSTSGLGGTSSTGSPAANLGSPQEAAASAGSGGLLTWPRALVALLLIILGCLAYGLRRRSLATSSTWSPSQPPTIIDPTTNHKDDGSGLL